jgi:hypothetical protein
MARARRSARTTQKRKDLKNPGRLDFEKANKIADEVVRRNVEWLKEMAKK